MPNKNDEKLWNIVEQRISRIKDDSLPTKQEIDELHATLDKRQDGESVFDWLSRVLVTKGRSNNVITLPIQKPIIVSVLTKRAASDGNRVTSLEHTTDDNRFLITAHSADGLINVKVEVLGNSINYLREKGVKFLKLTNNRLLEEDAITIPLDAQWMEGEMTMTESANFNEILFSPDRNIEVRAYD